MHWSPMALKSGGEAGGKGFLSPHCELTRTSRGSEPPPLHIDVSVDTAGLYCQRNGDSTIRYLYIFCANNAFFVRFTKAINFFWVHLYFAQHSFKGLTGSFHLITWYLPLFFFFFFFFIWKHEVLHLVPTSPVDHWPVSSSALYYRLVESCSVHAVGGGGGLKINK